MKNIFEQNGIKNLEELNTKEVQNIAIKFAKDFIAVFPCHNLTKEILVNSISKAKMYKADFSDGSSRKILV